MLSFGRLGCPSFVGLGTLWLRLLRFLLFVGSCLPQEAQLDLPPVSGREPVEVARAKMSTAGGLDGWSWNEIK